MASTAIDWYERRDELQEGQAFQTADGAVKLDRRVPGDGTRWYVASWSPGYPNMPGTIYEKGYWCHDDNTIEPGDLIDRLPDDYAGERAA